MRYTIDYITDPSYIYEYLTEENEAIQTTGEKITVRVTTDLYWASFKAEQTFRPEYDDETAAHYRAMRWLDAVLYQSSKGMMINPYYGEFTSKQGAG
jgi:hypothetical protein